LGILPSKKHLPAATPSPAHAGLRRCSHQRRQLDGNKFDKLKKGRIAAPSLPTSRGNSFSAQTRSWRVTDQLPRETIAKRRTGRQPTTAPTVAYSSTIGGGPVLSAGDGPDRLHPDRATAVMWSSSPAGHYSTGNKFDNLRRPDHGTKLPGGHHRQQASRRRYGFGRSNDQTSEPGQTMQRSTR